MKQSIKSTKKLYENTKTLYLDKIFKKSLIKIKNEFKKYINNPYLNWNKANKRRS